MNEIIIQMLPAEKAGFLPEMYRWGIEVIKVIQKMENPVLTILVKFITALGTEMLYVPLILFILWWIDEKQGLRFAILIIVSAWVNSFMKELWKQPRPFNFEPSLGLAHESSYGAPSGHAQMSLTFWVPMAAWLSQVWEAKKPGRKKLIWAFAVFFILFIGFTRLYLGVHFPTDLFAGWLLAGIILVIWFIPGPSLEKFLAAAGVRVQAISAAALALLMTVIYPGDKYLPALFLGFCTGYVFMKSRFPFSARAPVNGKKPGIRIMIFRCVTGFLGIAVIYLGLRFIFPGEGSLFRDIPIWGKASPFYELGRFIRYGLIGLWASAGAPKIFQLMGLAALPESSGPNKKAGTASGEKS